jgi:hypothetical protein
LAKIEAQLRWVADCELFMLARVLRTPVQDLFPEKEIVEKFIGSPDFKRN